MRNWFRKWFSREQPAPLFGDDQNVQRLNRLLEDDRRLFGNACQAHDLAGKVQEALRSAEELHDELQRQWDTEHPTASAAQRAVWIRPKKVNHGLADALNHLRQCGELAAQLQKLESDGRDLLARVGTFVADVSELEAVRAAKEWVLDAKRKRKRSVIAMVALGAVGVMVAYTGGGWGVRLAAFALGWGGDGDIIAAWGGMAGVGALIAYGIRFARDSMKKADQQEKQYAQVAVRLLVSGALGVSVDDALERIFEFQVEDS